MGQKLGDVPLWGGDQGPYLAQRGQGPGLPACQSFILIHPSVWPPYINVTDRQWFDGIGLTVLQTVAQKIKLHRFKLCC